MQVPAGASPAIMTGLVSSKLRSPIIPCCASMNYRSRRAKHLLHDCIRQAPPRRRGAWRRERPGACMSKGQRAFHSCCAPRCPRRHYSRHFQIDNIHICAHASFDSPSVRTTVEIGIDAGESRDRRAHAGTPYIVIDIVIGRARCMHTPARPALSGWCGRPLHGAAER